MLPGPAAPYPLPRTPLKTIILLADYQISCAEEVSGMGRLTPLIVALVSVLLMAGAGMVALRGNAGDPLASLPPPEHGLTAERTVLSPQKNRLVEHITLHGGRLGDIALSLSLPEPLPAGKLPVVMVLAGQATGENSIRYIKNIGNNALAGYTWPVPTRLNGLAALIWQGPELYHRVMSIPAQVASAMEWLTEQPWADAHRVSLLGFSQGALAVPAVSDSAARDGTPIGWTVLAYGGAPLGALLATHPRMKPAWLGAALGPLTDWVFHDLEPTVHLPRLTGKFLVLEGRDDRLIPAAARANLREAVPEPKTVITLAGSHMGVDRASMALLREIIQTSTTWLEDNGAINRSTN